MAIGLAGDTVSLTAGDQTAQLSLVEQRVLSNLLQSLLGTNQAVDDLRVLRNDQGFELGITPLPIPGN